MAGPPDRRPAACRDPRGRSASHPRRCRHRQDHHPFRPSGVAAGDRRAPRADPASDVHAAGRPANARPYLVAGERRGPRPERRLAGGAGHRGHLSRHRASDAPPIRGDARDSRRLLGPRRGRRRRCHRHGPRRAGACGVDGTAVPAQDAAGRHLLGRCQHGAAAVVGRPRDGAVGRGLHRRDLGDLPWLRAPQAVGGAGRPRRPPALLARGRSGRSTRLASCRCSRPRACGRISGRQRHPGRHPDRPATRRPGHHRRRRRRTGAVFVPRRRTATHPRVRRRLPGIDDGHPRDKLPLQPADSRCRQRGRRRRDCRLFGGASGGKEGFGHGSAAGALR